jgi:uncharacterized integral membrane protein
VNSGSGAVRALVGAWVPPAVLVGALVVVAGVVAAAVVVVLDVLLVGALCVAAGALAAVTVFVCEPPQPPSATTPHAPSASSVNAPLSLGLITAMVFGARPAVPPPYSDSYTADLRPGTLPDAPSEALRSTQRRMSAPSAQIPGPGGKPKSGQRRGTVERMRSVGPLILAAIFIAFAVLNLNQVKVDWIVGSGHAPLIIVIVISVLVGIVLTHFAERVGRRRR